MSFNLIQKSQYQYMPWKNGQGTTAQIQIYPENSSVIAGDFQWRLSSATVQASGPFSLFPGCDRLLVVLEGKGLMLNHTRLELLHPIQFSGEYEIDCKLLDEEVVDLGLIYRRDQVHAEMIVETVEAGLHQWCLQEKTHLFFLHSGSCEVSGLRMEAGETLYVTGEKEIALRVLSSEGAKFVHIKIAD